MKLATQEIAPAMQLTTHRAADGNQAENPATNKQTSKRRDPRQTPCKKQRSAPLNRPSMRPQGDAPKPLGLHAVNGAERLIKTGDEAADADIAAFYKARNSLLQGRQQPRAQVT